MNDLFLKLSDKQLLLLCIDGEAEGEPIEGQIAVGCVVRNRVHHATWWGNSYASVILKPEQFSCFNENDVNYGKLLRMAEGDFNDLLTGLMEQLSWVATGIIANYIMDTTGGATSYITTTLFNSDKRPKWATPDKITKHIGTQVFFKV